MTFMAERGIRSSLIMKPDKKTAGKADNSSEELIGLLIELRQRLREMKEWQPADDIRARLGELDHSIEDGSTGEDSFVRD
jgi:cysteinyl-tRNA synthetase